MLFSIPFDCSYYDTIILVHRGFGDLEVFRRGPHGGPGIDHVHSQLPGPVIHIVRHQIPLRCCVLGIDYVV